MLKAGVIRSSFIPDDAMRELRKLCRERLRYVKMQTQIKNRIHKTLSRNNIKLGSIFSDIFSGKGLQVLKAIVEGKPIEQILAENKKSKIMKKKQKALLTLKTNLSSIDIDVLKGNLLTLAHSKQMIAYLEERIEVFMDENLPEEAKIILTVPGIGKILAAVILAEIACRFPTAKNLVSYAGLLPAHQSSKKKRMKKPSKKSNKYLKWAMVEASSIKKVQKFSAKKILSIASREKKQVYCNSCSGKKNANNYTPFIAKKGVLQRKRI